MNKKIIVYTRVYNTKPYLEQCIDSVLSQTYPNFIYIVVDNGCTDGSSEIINSYAERDSRICRIRYEKNASIFTKEVIQKYVGADGDYIAILDSDDWWESNYLERLLKLAEDTDSDIVSTGTLMHMEANGQTGERKLGQHFVLERFHYADAFPAYHCFFRTVWAKLIQKELYMSSIKSLTGLGISYGVDTLNAFALLRKANRVYLDDSMLYHYRIHSKSSSHKWEPRRIFSDQYLYDDAENFLRPYGTITPQNRKFLNIVYANTTNDTLKVLNGAKNITAEERLAELEKIAEYSHTKEVFSMDALPCKTCRELYIVSIIACASKLGKESDSKIISIAKLCMPSCGVAINAQSARLFWKQRDLLTFFINDDRFGLVQCLMNYIGENKFAKLYDLGRIIADLSWDKPLLHKIENNKFLKKYNKIYLFIWQEKYEEALELMTDMLLKKEIPHEDFLILYSNLSALLERTDEFIFSKVRLAKFYLLQKRFEEYQNVLTDLKEMGVEDTEGLL